MLVIVGLGNPGNEYKNTYHNMGFMVVEEIANKFGEKFTKKLAKSEVCVFHVNNEKIMLVKPQTYMNNSGLAVSEIVNKYKIDPSSELVVISDDIDIKEGTIRIRKESNSSTHNGVRSIVSMLGTNKFIRIKVSIAPRPEFGSLADYVLSKVSGEYYKKSLEKAVHAVLDFIENKDADSIMQKYSN